MAGSQQTGQWMVGIRPAQSGLYFVQEEFHFDGESSSAPAPCIRVRKTLGAFLVNRESFMASHDFEKFMDVNDGA